MNVRKTRNDRRFWYSQYLTDRVPGDVAIAGAGIVGISVVNDDEPNVDYLYDEYGNETGERQLHYAEPVEMYANISPASGQKQVERFGTLENYDKVIVTRDLSCPINEHTVLFVDKTPERNDKQQLLYDYVVMGIAKSLNSISIAIRKVQVG